MEIDYTELRHKYSVIKPRLTTFISAERCLIGKGNITTKPPPTTLEELRVKDSRVINSWEGGVGGGVRRDHNGVLVQCSHLSSGIK